MATRERTSEDVLRMVVNLLNKKEDKGATPEEAASAAAMAQSLMLKYNLTTVDLTKASTTKITEGAFSLQHQTWKEPDAWQFDLLEGICKYNFCMVLRKKYDWNIKLQRNVWTTVVVLGASENVQLVEYLYLYLFREIHRLALKGRRDAVKEAKIKFADSWRTTDGDMGIPSELVWERSFGDGAAKQVVEKLRLQRLMNEEEVSADEGKMVLMLDQQVEEEWYKRKYGKAKAEVVKEREEAQQRAEAQYAEYQAKVASGVIKEGKVKASKGYGRGRSLQYDYRAEAAGHDAGKRIQINRGVSGAETPAKPKEIGN